MKKLLFAVTLIAAFSVFAMGSDLAKTARDSAKGAVRSHSEISLSAPHACTVEKSHPCVYYGGDINAGDPEYNGLSNENDLFIANSWTYTEVDSPVTAKISGAFSNNLSTYGVIDPKTANWDFRTGVSEGNGGTDIKSGTGAAEFTATGRNEFGFNEYELLTATPVSVPKGDVFYGVQPNCTNSSDPDCTSDPRYFESDTDGTLNGINTKFTVTSNNGFGPVFESPQFFGVNWASWCNDEGVACGDGMSAGILK